MSLTWLRAFATMTVRDEVLEDSDERTVYATFPPLGVCAGIVPWNWPVLLGLGKLGPALLTGNCFVMKPSPYTPYCDLKLGELARDVFPPGVVQVLSGDDSLGPWMTEVSLRVYFYFLFFLLFCLSFSRYTFFGIKISCSRSGAGERKKGG